MKTLVCRLLFVCGFWLLINSCGGVGHATRPQQLEITSAVLPQAVLKETYNGGAGFTVTAAGGVPPYRWTWAAANGSTLPPGLSFSSNADGTGTISGVPTSAGPFGAMVTVTDSEIPPVQKVETYIITVAVSNPSGKE